MVGSVRTAALEPGSCVADRAALRRCRDLVDTLRFAEGLRCATACAAHARHIGDDGVWRRFTTLRSAALGGLGRFPEVVVACDEVTDSSGADPGAHAQAWSIGAVAAHRAGRDDVLRRLDNALVLGEWFRDQHGRFESLVRAACSAGSVGLAELGERIFAGISEADMAISGPPTVRMWSRFQQVSVSLWWALALEHAGDPGAIAVYERALAAARDPAADADLPPHAAAVFAAFAGFALTALGRRAEGGEALAAAVWSPPAEDLFGAAIELMCATSALRGPGPVPPDLVPRAVAAARRCGDVRVEAEVWRQVARRATLAGDGGGAAAATERFDALVERLDWRVRLQSVELLTFRSRTLHRIVRGEDWRGPLG